MNIIQQGFVKLIFLEKFSLLWLILRTFAEPFGILQI